MKYVVFEVKMVIFEIKMVIFEKNAFFDDIWYEN